MKDPLEHDVPGPGRSWWFAIGAIVVVAAVLRLCNLGTFSLWLDEAFTMHRAEMPFLECLADCATDAENVPLYAIVTYLSLRLGLLEPWIRLVPIAAGIVSIVTWAWWTRRHFGSCVALVTAGFFAVSTFHLRQSQELRAYPFLLLITSLTVLAGDRLRRRPELVSALLLAAIIGVGWYTHLTYGMVLVPLIGVVLAGADTGATGGGRRRGRPVALLALAVSLGTLTLLPWMLVTLETLQRRLSRGATDWTLEIVGRRWQFLTVAAAEGELLDWLGALLGILALAGLAVALRSRPGRAVLLPAAATAIGIEFLFLAVNRWSKARYVTAVWPFLAILVVLGLLEVLRSVPRRRLRLAACAALAAAMLVRVDGYHRLGRPHWDRIITAIEEVRRPGEPLLAENEWSRYLLDYLYDGPVVALEHDLEPLLENLARRPSVLLVSGPPPRSREVRSIARRSTLLAAIPQTARLYRVRADVVGGPEAARGDGWPVPASQLVSEHLETPLPGCLGRLVERWRRKPPERATRLRIEFDAASSPMLRSGWSRPKTSRDGGTYAWAVGREASVVVRRRQPSPANIAIRLRPARGLDSQRLRVLVNGQALGTTGLQTGPETVSLNAPPAVWRSGRNLVVLQFRDTTEVADERSKPLAAAVDWIRVIPKQPAEP